MSRNSTTIAAGIKLGIFTLVSLLVTGLLAAIMGNVGFGAGKTYQAVFSNASMLEKGDDVRIAGVSVGEVKEVEHHERNHALVTFRVKADVPMTTSTRAEIRFKNLVGDRYLAIEEGKDGEAPGLDEDDVIPISNTSPALDLTVLFNGFKPLFTALQPDQVDELSLNLVRVLQGEGGTVQSLLANTASLTNGLADRDKLIGDVITNLSQTMDTVNDRHTELKDLIVELKGWMSDLARDRKTIGSSLDNISDLTEVVAGLLKESRPWLKADVAELRKLADLLTQPASEKMLGDLLDRLPESMTDQTRTGTYGSWYNYYLCAASVRIKLPVVSDIPLLDKLQDQIGNFKIKSNAARCQ
ncbi:MCE family protein [Nocardioides sp. JQ2195]|uniref:MCE family protein n=1 Tax=Nocardioides sp. JQ2195 TaxID=2592334 RepID=UPI00143EAD61|nr:MCE family protein [Nocardioides sp. JQ2195]QIX26620.1 MCE family protein [Nocardioides sp. JQ2195]